MDFYNGSYFYLGGNQHYRKIGRSRKVLLLVYGCSVLIQRAFWSGMIEQCCILIVFGPIIIKLLGFFALSKSYSDLETLRKTNIFLKVLFRGFQPIKNNYWTQETEYFLKELLYYLSPCRANLGCQEILGSLGGILGSGNFWI